MVKVGITGGIGSGKSTVSKLFEILDVPVYYADDRAKILMEEDADLIKAIKKEFGKDIYNTENQLKKQELANVIFNDELALKVINTLVHPTVSKDSLKWFNAIPLGTPYAIKEAALLFESGSHRELDFVIVVSADEELRIKRVQKRSKLTEDQIRQRMKNQMPDSYKEDLSDALIFNNKADELIPQVMAMHKKIMMNDL